MYVGTCVYKYSYICTYVLNSRSTIVLKSCTIISETWCFGETNLLNKLVSDNDCHLSNVWNGTLVHLRCNSYVRISEALINYRNRFSSAVVVAKTYTYSQTIMLDKYIDMCASWKTSFVFRVFAFRNKRIHFLKKYYFF